MIGRPPRYTHELVDHLLQELERGRTLVDICAEPGMPSGTAVRRWIDENINGFAARYRAAREVGRPLRRTSKTYTPEIADRILQEVALGRAVRDICAEPGMPCQKTIENWVEDDIDGFAARYRAAREAGEPLREYPTRYTPELADKIVGEVTSGKTLTDVCREPGMPSITTIKHWVADNRADFTARYRQAQEIGRALSGGPLPYSAELADRVLGELMQGRTLIAVCDDPGMPCIGAVMLWVRRDRDGFAARYREAREIGGQIMVDQLVEIGDDSRRDHIRRRNQSGETEVVVDHENIRRSELRCENRRWIMTRAMPRVYGDRLEVTAKHEPGDGWAELLTAIDGTPRRLPSEEENTDGQ
jgi:transposase-like protein